LFVPFDLHRPKTVLVNIWYSSGCLSNFELTGFARSLAISMGEDNPVLGKGNIQWDRGFPWSREVVLAKND